MRFKVEVTIRGFGPGHPLWRGFVDSAAARQRAISGVSIPGCDDELDDGYLRLDVDALIPHDAVREAMSFLREVGQDVDRHGSVLWAAMTATAVRRRSS